jgi:hypothetical protein
MDIPGVHRSQLEKGPEKMYRMWVSYMQRTTTASQNVENISDPMGNFFSICRNAGEVRFTISYYSLTVTAAGE